MSASEVLFIQTAFVGDLLLSIPTLRALRTEHPGCKITLLCRKGLGDFMRAATVVDEVIEADKTSDQNWTKVVQILSGKVWSHVYCPHQSPRSLMLVRKLNASRKIGYRSILGRLIFDEALERPMHLPEALRQLVLLPSKRTQEVLNFEPQTNKNIYRRMPKPKDKKDLVITEKLKAVPVWASMEIHSLKSAKQNLVVLAPGSVWNTKKWTEQGFAEAAAHYLSRGKTVHLVGAPDEREICERVKEAASSIASSASGKIINSAGKLSLWQSAQLMGSAELVIANDSGAMHMAACAGTPTISVFGPTVLEQGYRPWQTQARVLHTVLSCRPCGKHGARKCPIGTHECMKLIPANAVISASKELI
jgi:heptosyltransferase II